jgi:hypothetical protein
MCSPANRRTVRGLLRDGTVGRRTLPRNAPLTLRPTGLSGNPEANDWSVREDGVAIGRLYKDLQATRSENRWFWSITVTGPARFRVRTDSRAPTLEQAKADFLAALAAFKAVRSPSLWAPP